MGKKFVGRKCVTKNCKKVSALHPHCKECRVENCKACQMFREHPDAPHPDYHYDAGYAQVCNTCGTTIRQKTKTSARKVVNGLHPMLAGAAADYGTGG